MSIRLVATVDCPANGVDQVGLLMGKDRPKIENERAASNSSHDGGVTGSHRVAVKAVEWPSVCLMSLGDSLAVPGTVDNSATESGDRSFAKAFRLDLDCYATVSRSCCPLPIVIGI